MKTNHFVHRAARYLLPVLLTLAVAATVSAQKSPTLEELSHAAVSTDPAVAEQAIHSLREYGPDGLHALLTTHAATIKQHATASVITFIPAQPDAAWQRLRTALDRVGQQRDCSASQLFWFTDFEQAKAAAKVQNKPILSLRLLGKLDEEFSCANSRFFRTTLYANTEVAQYLREHFVLHWKSVRPVPRVTIDFGDGRKLERTITGNSIHYVLAPDGEVVDALPGLYGAKAFLRGLQRAADINQQSFAKPSAERQALLTAYHRNRLTALNAEFDQDLQKISPAAVDLVGQVSLLPAVFSLTPPSAETAMQVTTLKGGVETPMLERTRPSPRSTPQNNRAAIDDTTWQKIAALHAEDATLDASAKKLITAKGSNAIEASRRALSKSIVEDPMLPKMRAMERSISEDTVRNEYQLHRQIHEWLANNQTPPVDQLNSWVYAELFLTPDSDPWLGLLPADAYAALENDGLSLTAKR
jgi:hypothetical protein